VWGQFHCVEDPPLSWRCDDEGFEGYNNWFVNCNIESSISSLDFEWCSRSWKTPKGLPIRQTRGKESSKLTKIRCKKLKLKRMLQFRTMNELS